MQFDELSHRVIGCALEVHRFLGPGMLESTYEQCLAHELSINEIPFRLQVPLPVNYKGILLDCGYRADVLVGDAAADERTPDRIILELKAIEKLLPIHEAQLLIYMKLAKIRVGLLINFNVTMLKEGLKRVVL